MKKCINWCKASHNPSVTTLFIALFTFSSLQHVSAAGGHYQISVIKIYDMIFNCNWFDTRWQQYSTHLHTNNT